MAWKLTPKNINMYALCKKKAKHKINKTLLNTQNILHVFFKRKQKLFIITKSIYYGSIIISLGKEDKRVHQFWWQSLAAFEVFVRKLLSGRRCAQLSVSRPCNTCRAWIYKPRKRNLFPFSPQGILSIPSLWRVWKNIPYVKTKERRKITLNHSPKRILCANIFLKRMGAPLTHHSNNKKSSSNVRIEGNRKWKT